MFKNQIQDSQTQRGHANQPISSSSKLHIPGYVALFCNSSPIITLKSLVMLVGTLFVKTDQSHPRVHVVFKRAICTFQLDSDAEKTNISQGSSLSTHTGIGYELDGVRDLSLHH